jgi:transcriptional regulator GlxA family with amidase domain
MIYSSEIIITLNNTKKTDSEALFISSHCDGAFVLAQAILLNNSVFTTFRSAIDALRNMFPELDIRKEVLFVQDGTYITSAAAEKSVDAALCLCKYIYGKDSGQSLVGG